MRNLSQNSKKINGYQLRSPDRLSVRSVPRSLRKSPCPDPTFEDHTRIVQSVNRTNSPYVDRSNFNTSSCRNSPQKIVFLQQLH